MAFWHPQDASAHLASTMAAASLAAGDSSPIRSLGFIKIIKFTSFQKKNKPSFNPARRLQQGQRVLLPNGMVAFAMPVRLPFKVLHPTRINGINVSSFKQKA